MHILKTGVLGIISSIGFMDGFLASNRDKDWIFDTPRPENGMKCISGVLKGMNLVMMR